MKRLKIFIVITLLFFSCFTNINASVIKGNVSGIGISGNQELLAGANIILSDTGKGITADADGLFAVDITDSDPAAYLVVSYVGFISDSIKISAVKNDCVKFVLKEGVSLTETVVTGARQGTVLSGVTVQKTELITSAGLMKMACCNLSESFENSATITVGFTDAVSGAKQVQLLGLSGI